MINTITQIATAYNTLDTTVFNSLIADDFVYESQNVFEPISGKENFMVYINGKFSSIKESGSFVFAEICYLGRNDTPCIIISQGTKEKKGALLIIEINQNNKIRRMDMCTVAPNWSTAKRTNIYPGLE